MQSITGINSVDFNNINTEEGENLINNLPNEVLSIIFSKLDDNSIQNSSFVCKRWKSLVIYPFRTRYLNSIRQIISSQLSKKGFIEKNIIKELKSDDILLNSIRRKFIFFVSLLELKKFVIKNLNKGLDNPVFEEYNRLLFDTKFFSYALKEADCKEDCFGEKYFSVVKSVNETSLFKFSEYFCNKNIEYGNTKILKFEDFLTNHLDMVIKNKSYGKREKEELLNICNLSSEIKLLNHVSEYFFNKNDINSSLYFLLKTPPLDWKEEFVEKIFFKLLDENRFDECLEIAEKTISCPFSAFRTFALVVRLLETGKVDQAKECFSVLCPDVNFNETLHHEVIDNKGRLPLELAYLFAHAITDNEELKEETLRFIEENRRLFEVYGS